MIILFMKLNELIRNELGVDFPKRYQIVGHVLIVKNVYKKQKEIAELILSKYKYIRTVCFIKEISGDLREPIIENTFGDGTETIHKEHGIFYKLDVAKIMFSKGNLNERKRLIGLIKKNEIILDMFAGIGYFSLGIAKHHPDAKIYAVEKNPIAFKYLRENIKLNKIKNIIPILDDNRDKKLREEIPKVDRIIMGYIPATEKFLPVALNYIKNNGIINFHNTYKKEELWDFAEEQIRNIIESYGFKLKILQKKKVKSFAPKIYHVVMDVNAWK